MPLPVSLLAELAKRFGNLVNRSFRCSNGTAMEGSDSIMELGIDARPAMDSAKAHLAANELQDALMAIWTLLIGQSIRRSNRSLQIGQRPVQAARLDEVLYNLAECCRVLAVLLSPFIPDTSAKILNQLNLPRLG